MLIRNNSSDQINLGFVNHVIRLEPGEIAEVEEIIVEEPSFQNLENLGILEILDFEPDPTRLAVKQEIDGELSDLDVRVSALEAAGSVTASQEYNFSYWSIPSSTVGPMFLEIEFADLIPVRFNGFLTRAYIRVSSARTNGGIQVRPTKNGTPIVDSALQLDIGLANPQEQVLEIPVGNLAYEFTKEDKLGAQITSSLFAPVGANVLVSYVLTQV